ncbi:MAG: hypothetical protein KC912_14060 [Proteobacteria bacterium]|nr:hypothetical protein [Pseudomonadota bacterium]
MIALAMALAFADPVAHREPGLDGYAVHIGTPEAGAAVWFLDDFGLAVGLRNDLGAVELSAVERRQLTGEGAWGLDLHGAFGAGIGLVRPWPYLTTTLALHGGFRGDKFAWTIGPAAPIAYTFVGGWRARFPLLVETFIGPRIGKVRLMARGAAGTVLSPGLAPSFAAQAGLSVTIRR